MNAREPARDDGAAGGAGATRRAIVSVIHNFLGTYVSRYSSYDGYWLFGFLVPLPGTLVVDLLATEGSADEPHTPAGAERDGSAAARARAATLARARFGEQLAKARVPRAVLARAALTLRTVTEHGRARLPEGGREAVALAFEVVIVAASGRVYRGACSAWVAPHDATLERRSASGRVG